MPSATQAKNLDFIPGRVKPKATNINPHPGHVVATLNKALYGDFLCLTRALVNSLVDVELSKERSTVAFLRPEEKKRAFTNQLQYTKYITKHTN